MRFVVEAKPVDGGWEVAVHGIAQPDGLRRMQRVGEFPQRLEAQPGPDVEKTDLWNQTDPDRLRSVFGRIASGTPSRREVALFGQYLFQALLGDALWQAVREKAAAAGDDLIELALSFQEKDPDLHRLPWETLHSGTSFLTAEAQRLVAITRLVPGPQEQAATRTVEARVLFVVGAAPNDPELRPGAEYLGLMRRLEANGLGLSSHLLLQATDESLRDTVLEIRPSIVHVIAHGAFRNGRAVLKLTDKDTRKPTREVTGDQLANILREPVPEDPNWRGPAIVVLNACYSGQAFGGLGGALPKDREIWPLAAELVHRGIPLVVGMGGRVADRACRIFTRRFYETLLQGDPIRGIAQGRRAGHGEGTSPEDTIDWALPVLFLDPAVTVTVDKNARFPTIVRQAFQSLVGEMDHKPTAFCGRLPCMADLKKLVADGSVPERGGRVMAVYENLDSTPFDKSRKYGRTWLLDQLALQAVQNGHASCVVKFEEREDPPATLLQMADAIRTAAEQTYDHFGLEPPVSSEILKLKNLHKGSGSLDTLEEELKLVVQEDAPDSPASVRLALRLDLLRLRAAVRKHLAYPSSQVLVLIDNLHRSGAAKEFVSDRFLRAEGLGVKGDPIPVVYSFWKEEAVPPSTYDALKDHVGKNSVIKHQLTSFDSPITDRMPYEQYLLQLVPPLIPIPAPENEPKVVEGLLFIYNRMKGVPSKFEEAAETIKEFVSILTDRFQPADDEDWLKKERLQP